MPNGHYDATNSKFNTLMGGENTNNIEKAQKVAKAKIKEKEKLKNQVEECRNKQAEAQKASDEAKNKAKNFKADEIVEAKDMHEKAIKDIEWEEERLKKCKRDQNRAGQNWTAVKKEEEDSWFSPDKDDVKKAEAAYDRSIQRTNAAREALNRREQEERDWSDKCTSLDAYNKYDEAKALISARENAQKKLDDQKAECDKIDEELKKMPEDDILDKLKAVPKGRKNVTQLGRGSNRSKSGIFGWGGTFEDEKLYDLRNVNGNNFRGWDSDSRKMLKEAGTTLSPSRSFYMNQNYLFSDSLAKISDFQNFRSSPEIQQLIVSEFQPYDVLSIGDLLAGAMDTGASVLAAGAKAVGRSCSKWNKKFIDKQEY